MHEYLRTTARLVVLALLALFGGVDTADAQSIKVQQVKGKRAIVEFYGMEPRVNQSYLLGEDSMVPDAGDRTKTIAVTGEISSVTSSTGNSSVFSAQGQYGWIRPGGIMEYGPLVGYVSTSRSGSSSTTSRLTLGGFFDYNLIPNTGAEKLIYGATVNASYGAISTSGASSTALAFEAGGVVKWFFARSTTALRGGALITQTNVSGSASSYSESGFKLTAGLQFYL